MIGVGLSVGLCKVVMVKISQVSREVELWILVEFWWSCTG